MTDTTNTGDGGRWYVRRGKEVRGPFRWEMIEKFVALGRIRGSDRLSADGLRWQKLRALRSLRAAAGIAASTGGVASLDERRGERRAAPVAAPREDTGGVRTGSDRRALESAEVVERRAHSERVWAGLRARSQRARGPLLATAGVLVGVLAVALIASMPRERTAPDCAAAAGPRANWDFCSKQAIDLSDRELDQLSARNAKLTGANLAGSTLAEADLAYADLTAADLSLANLEGARLVGATLRQARLGHARLAGADLRFVDLTGAELAGTDLTGAHLASAIWTDGSLCARHSVGACRPRPH